MTQVTIQCIDCRREREVARWELWHVQRCKDCQRIHESQRKAELASERYRRDKVKILYAQKEARLARSHTVPCKGNCGVIVHSYMRKGREVEFCSGQCASRYRSMIGLGRHALEVQSALLYMYDNGCTGREVASALGVSPAYVAQKTKQAGIRRTDREAHQLRSIRKQGFVGHVTAQGYKRLTLGDGTHILEHRLVMQRRLGRPLRSNEFPHHMNGDRLDNRDENLELWVVGRGQPPSGRAQPSGQRASDLVKWARAIERDLGSLFP